MAQLVNRLTLDFSSGHDLTVGEFEPRICSDSMEIAWDTLSPFLSLSLSLSAPLLLSISKINFLRMEGIIIISGNCLDTHLYSTP